MIKAAGARGRFKERDYCLILLMFRHGLRASEAATLEWSAVDLKDNKLKLNRLKGGKSGDHPLQPDELETLITLRTVYPDSNFVFPAERGEHISVGGLEKMVSRAAQLAGLKLKVHPHMLRHSCGFFLANQGAPTRDIQDWLGHISILNTVRYTAENPARFDKFDWSWEI